MIKAFSEDAAKLILRVVLAALLLFHGISKMKNGVGWMEGMLEGHGIPGFVAYGVFLGEVVAPILLLAGAYVRIAGMLVIGNMLVALLLVHTGQLFATDPQTGGYALELQAFYLTSGILVFLFGAGRFALFPSGKWN